MHSIVVQFLAQIRQMRSIIVRHKHATKIYQQCIQQLEMRNSLNSWTCDSAEGIHLNNNNSNNLKKKENKPELFFNSLML